MLEEYQQFYDKMFDGFETIGEEDSYSESDIRSEDDSEYTPNSEDEYSEKSSSDYDSEMDSLDDTDQTE